MKIRNCETNLYEQCHLIKVLDGYLFYDLNKEPMLLDNDHIIKIGKNYYKIKDLELIIEYYKNKLK